MYRSMKECLFEEYYLRLSNLVIVACIICSFSTHGWLLNVKFDLPNSLLSSVSDPDSDADPFGSVSFWSAGSGSGSASMKRIRIRVEKISLNHGKFSQKSTKITRISHNSSKMLNFYLTDINIYHIYNKTNHFWEKYILFGKKVFKSWYFLY